jgi:hypothetical protein
VRQRPLARGREQPLGGELLLELLQRQRLGAEPGRLREVDVELEPSVALVDAEPAAHAHRHPGIEAELHPLHVGPPHHRLDHRALVAQLEVHVTADRARHLHHLAFDPDDADPAVERAGREPDQLHDRHRSISRGARRGGGVLGHGASYRFAMLAVPPPDRGRFLPAAKRPLRAGRAAPSGAG